MAKEVKANGDILDAIVTEQNQISTSALDRDTFLAFYRDTLAIFYRLEPKKQLEFLAATYTRLQDLHLSYDEILALTQSAAPDRPRHLLHPDARSASQPLGKWTNDNKHLTVNQGMLLVSLIGEQAPEAVQALLRLVRFEKKATYCMAAALFPQFAYVDPKEKLNRYQIRAYHALLAQFWDIDTLVPFLKESADAYYDLEPTSEDFLAAARAFTPPPRVDLSNFKAMGEAAKTLDLLHALRFLKFHLENHNPKIRAKGYIDLTEYYQAEVIRLAPMLKDFLEYVKNQWITTTQPIIRYNDEAIGHLYFVTGEEVYQGLSAIPAGPIHSANVGEVLSVAEHMEKRLGVEKGKVLEYLSGALSRASDVASFSTLFRRGQGPLKKVANSRFADFASWRPPADLLIEIFGGKTIKTEHIAATVTPEQFNVLFFEALRVNHWHEPSEMEAFLSANYQRYFSLEPPPNSQQLIAFLRAIQHRPVPITRAMLEGEIGKQATLNTSDLVDVDRQKRLFLELALYELEGCTQGRICLDPTKAEDRRKLRSRLLSLLGRPLVVYYPDINPTPQLAHLFSDLVLYEGLTSSAPAERLLALLSDDPSPVAFEIVSKSLRQSPTSLGLRQRSI